MRSMLVAASNRLIEWFRDSALDLWLANGFDDKGGCFSQLESDGSADESASKLLRSQAQMAMLLAQLREVKWIDAEIDRTIRGLYRFSSRWGCLPDRSDGYVSTLAADCTVEDSSFDLTDHAYFVLASCESYKAFGDYGDMRRAVNIVKWLDRCFTHPKGGWYEGSNMDSTNRFSHSHLVVFEAFLSLWDVTRRPFWRQRADALYYLFNQHFFSENASSIPPVFDDDWKPLGAEQHNSDYARWYCALNRYCHLAELDPLKHQHLVLTSRYLPQGKVDKEGNLTALRRCLGGEAMQVGNLIHAGYVLSIDDLDHAEAYQNVVLNAIEVLFTDFIAMESPALAGDKIDKNGKLVEQSSVATLWAVGQAAIAAQKWLSRHTL